MGIEPDQEVAFEEYTDEEIASLRSLIEENRVQDFVEANPDPDERSTRAVSTTRPHKNLP